MKRFLPLMSVLVVAMTACGGPTQDYNAFATCIANSGAKFYGAFWCPHCKDQKEMFGDAAEKLPYVECAEGGKNAQVQLCLDEKVESYPTWKFQDGTTHVGTMELQDLADQTACPLDAPESVMRQ